MAITTRYFDFNEIVSTSTIPEAGEWPSVEGDYQVATVKAFEFTGTHSMDYTDNGILTICVDDGLLKELAEVPPYVEACKDIKGYIELNREGIAALRRLLATIDALEAQA